MSSENEFYDMQNSEKTSEMKEDFALPISSEERRFTKSMFHSVVNCADAMFRSNMNQDNLITPDIPDNLVNILFLNSLQNMSSLLFSLLKGYAASEIKDPELDDKFSHIGDFINNKLDDIIFSLASEDDD